MNHHLTRVALVMPVYNRRDITLQALRSLRRVDATGLEIKIFIVDDGSTDGTSDAIRRDFPEVELIAGDGTLHYAAGTNRGITAAMTWQADFVVTMNDDAVYHDQFLQRLIATATANPRSIVGGLLLLWAKPHHVFQVAPVWKTLGGGWFIPENLTAFNVGDEPFQVDCIVGNCVIFPAAAIRECGLMDEEKFPHGWGDAQYIERFRRAGWNLLVDPRALIWCEPNTYPPSLHTMPIGRMFEVLFKDRRHPQNLQRQFIARWESAPSKLKAVVSYLIYVANLAAKSLFFGAGRLVSMTGKIFLSVARAYTYWSPVDRGKYRLLTLAMRVTPELPPPTVVKTRDGCLIRADLSSGMHTFVYFLGDYEPAISDLVRLLVDPGKVCIDAGANFGWYSILFNKLAGKEGQVHAFEPVPKTFAELTENFELAGSPTNLHINQIALAESPGELTINLFAGMPSGHASLSDQGRTDATHFTCISMALDTYLADRRIGQVDFVKVDIEGAELGFLQGARSLFSQPNPPFIVMEMALNQSKNFGYRPDDLIRFISEQNEYSFYKIEESSRTLARINGFASDDIGANVLCVPRTRIESLDRLKNWLRMDPAQE